MSFVKYHDNIEEGDVALIYIKFKKMLPLKVKSGEVTQTRFGAIRHSDMIGVRFGSKIQCSKGWVHVLHPTPELWTLSLCHRTQILYSPDISLIVFNLELKPGSIVAESGTGSGSLSHALIRNIMPMGHLHTFEFHAERADAARCEFIDHGLGDCVTVYRRDVCCQGFGLDHVVDAVFLDVPQPWDAIESAVKAIKVTGGRICSFSPCIEQVQRTCAKLREYTFEDIDTIECIQRSLNVRKCTMPRADLGSGYTHGNAKRKLIKLDETGDDEKVKKMNSSEVCEKDEDIQTNQQETKSNEDGSVKSIGEKHRVKHEESLRYMEDGLVYQSAVAPSTMLGHTGFLTIATLYDTHS